MKQYKTWFRIADVSICMVTPAPLTVEPAFQAYLTEPQESDVTCVFSQAETFPEPDRGSVEVFSDGMHRIFWSEQGAQQYFYIPYLYARQPAQRSPDLYQAMGPLPQKQMSLYFRPSAAAYFATAFGCFNAAKIERLLLCKDKLILHASYIAWQGKAIAFTANSGVGKSTQAALWEKYRGAELINGDRMAFGMDGGVMKAYGLPVAGSSGVFLNKTLPLGAVVLLGRGQESQAFRQHPGAAIRDLLQQVTVNRWDQRFMNVGCQTLSQMLAQVPVYTLLATPDEAAVDCLANILAKEGFGFGSMA